MDKSEFGVIGLGVMGKSLSLNMAEKGVNLSVYNRSEGDEARVVSEFLDKNHALKNIAGFTDLKDFVSSLELPRKMLLMVKAGPVVDDIIAQLLPHLTPDDVIIDGGNSYFKDTQRRYRNLQQKGIHFIGCGISGGEEGARKGPSLMPGGDIEGYTVVAPTLEAIAAEDAKKQPCCTFIGNDGAGHFVKMIHNGVEYAEMQLLAELYAILSPSMDNEAIADMFSKWNNSDLSSYLLEITVDILTKKEGGAYLLDKVLDKAENKGTGNWSSKTALDLGVPATMMTSAVFARYLSSFKATREQLSDGLQPLNSSNRTLDLTILEKAYRFARIINHHQGFEVLQQASQHYDWHLNLSEIACIWTNGCIIRSRFMEACSSYLKDASLLSQQDMFATLKSAESAIAEVLHTALSNRIQMDAFWSAYNYWINMTTKRLPANLIQAQRDYFGAHTYQRIDTPLSEFFHTNWSTS